MLPSFPPKQERRIPMPDTQPENKKQKPTIPSNFLEGLRTLSRERGDLDEKMERLEEKGLLPKKGWGRTPKVIGGGLVAVAVVLALGVKLGSKFVNDSPRFTREQAPITDSYSRSDAFLPRVEDESAKTSGRKGFLSAIGQPKVGDGSAKTSGLSPEMIDELCEGKWPLCSRAARLCHKHCDKSGDSSVDLDCLGECIGMERDRQERKAE